MDTASRAHVLRMEQREASAQLAARARSAGAHGARATPRGAVSAGGGKKAAQSAAALHAKRMMVLLDPPPLRVGGGGW